MRSLPWPEMESTQAPGHTIRSLLDYVAWVSRQMRQIGFHAGADREEWCRRVHRAYTALFVPMVPGHGDPYPPDVPPARNPGIWPDVPSARVPGMTLRHQLTVIEMLARRLRDMRWLHARAGEIENWDRRLALAHRALDHGAQVPMPDAERSEASKEALAEADAARRALEERARRRSEELRKHLRRRDAAQRKAEPTRAGSKKAAPRKTGSRKAASKKTASGGTSSRKTAPKKAGPKKTASRKTAPKKAAPKKAAPKKAAPKKAAPKKAAPKKAATKKTQARSKPGLKK